MQLKQRHPLIIYGIVTIKKAVNEESSSREQQQLRYFLNYLMKHIIFPTEWLNLVISPPGRAYRSRENLYSDKIAI